MGPRPLPPPSAVTSDGRRRCGRGCGVRGGELATLRTTSSRSPRSAFSSRRSPMAAQPPPSKCRTEQGSVGGIYPSLTLSPRGRGAPRGRSRCCGRSPTRRAARAPPPRRRPARRCPSPTPRCRRCTHRSIRIVSTASIHGGRLVAAGSSAAPSGSTINRVGCVRRRCSQITSTMASSTGVIAPSAG